MNINELTKKIESLPANVQKEVNDFINLLVQKQNVGRKRKSKTFDSLSKDKFIGLWSNRSDLENSTNWVKQIRNSNWTS